MNSKPVFGGNVPENSRTFSIKWTPELLAQFKIAYQNCAGDQFTFLGHQFLKAYAKYLIAYLDSVLHNTESRVNNSSKN